MKWSQRFFALGLALALTGGVSCTTGDGPTGIPEAQPVEQPAYLLGGVLDGVGGVLDITGLLRCEEQKYDVEYETIGPKGGTITVGKHSLVIPKGALRKNVRIKAEQMRGSTNSVRFSPEGLKFEKAATLSLNYKNCRDVKPPKAVVYTTENLEILEVLRSLDLLKQRTVIAPIDHFSRYALAY